MIPLLHFAARGDLETFFSPLEIQAFTAAFPCSGADVTDTLSRARSCPCFPARGGSDFSSSHLGSVGWGRQGLAQDKSQQGSVYIDAISMCSEVHVRFANDFDLRDC